ncbi:hypothetical protein [Hanstruepera ponticola]|uniref:hypothetical protein n=1 Tax=Hanstruepera ponticola TaxID=2042995 RepID=UPI000CF1C586|nr:hypothetical protein [Hanstruepera ponticola]
MKNIVLLLFFVLGSSCGDGMNQLKNDRFYSNAFEEQLKNNDLVMIDLSTTDEDWDSIIVLRPYTDIDLLEDELSLNLSNISLNRITTDDTINLFVFLKENKSVKIIEMSRVLGDFNNYDTIISKKDAKFKKTKNGLEFVK